MHESSSCEANATLDQQPAQQPIQAVAVSLLTMILQTRARVVLRRMHITLKCRDSTARHLSSMQMADPAHGAAHMQIHKGRLQLLVLNKKR